MPRLLVEQVLEGHQPLNDAFGVVETVDADDQALRTHSEFLQQLVARWSAHSGTIRSAHCRWRR